MKHGLFFIVCMMGSSIICAMQEDSREDDKKDGLLSIVPAHMVYIANKTVREKLQDNYGKEFDVNTVFVKIKFRKTTLNDLPEYIPFDYIKDCIEGDRIAVTLKKQERIFKCKQNTHYMHATFRNFLHEQYKHFVKFPAWHEGDAQELIKNNVLENSNDRITHGSNANSDIVRLKRNLY